MCKLTSEIIKLFYDKNIEKGVEFKLAKENLSLEELKNIIHIIGGDLEKGYIPEHIEGYRESNQVIILYNQEQKLNEYDKKIEEILTSPLISKRIGYNLCVYLKALDLMINYNKCDQINEAFNIIAKKAGVTIQSVVDKCYRQLGISSGIYKKYMLEALKGDISSISEILLSNLGRNTADYDEKIIKEVIK